MKKDKERWKKMKKDKKKMKTSWVIETFFWLISYDFNISDDFFSKNFKINKMRSQS